MGSYVSVGKLYSKNKISNFKCVQGCFHAEGDACTTFTMNDCWFVRKSIVCFPFDFLSFFNFNFSVLTRS